MLRAIMFSLIAAWFSIAPAASADVPAGPAASGLDLAAPADLMEASALLVPSAAGEYSVALGNTGARPVTRILKAADAPGTGLRMFPSAEHAFIASAESGQQAASVAAAPAHGLGAYRVTLAGSGSARLALRFSGTEGRPALLVWSEDALIRSTKQTAILTGAVNALLAASFAFALGVAILSDAGLSGIAAAFLASLLMAQLAVSGVFDGGIFAWSGPYALEAMALSAAVTAGFYLLDRVAPWKVLAPGLAPLLNHAAACILATGILAYANVPLSGLILRILALLAALAAPAYLYYCGQAGNAGARRLAPAASVFALVAASSALEALGVFGFSPSTPGAIGGFSAAGALVLAIAAAVPLDSGAARSVRSGAAHPPAPARDGPSRERAALAASLQGILDHDVRSGVFTLSGEAAAMFGLAPGAAELASESFFALVHPDDRGMFREAFDTYGRSPGVPFRIEFRATGKGGKYAWYELRASMIAPHGQGERCLGLIANVTVRKTAESRVSQAGICDPVTGLGTRNDLLARLDAMDGELKAAALAVFDVDRFKSVNVSLGREGGDEALAAFARRLIAAFPRPDGTGSMVYRAGGDMFAVAARDVTDLEAFGNRLLDLMHAPFRIGGRDIYLPSSVGVAGGANAEDPEALFAQAERAMVQAKREGGARAVVYTSALDASAARDAVAMDSGMRRALDKGEIEIHYQPVVRLSDRGLAGFEALMRWRHPGQGLVEPSDFVPLAERSGLIVPLGRFALEQSLKDLARWQAAAPSRVPLFVSVNAAWQQIKDKSFAGELAALVASSGLAARSLKLELTEGHLGADANVDMVLMRLKALGIGLSIDDFGAGHSSLGRLASFPFDTVKLDRSFLTGAKTKSGVKILRAMIALARDLKMSVICEGVETEAEAARLKRMGCDYGQGFLFGVPAPASVIDATIKAGSQ